MFSRVFIFGCLPLSVHTRYTSQNFCYFAMLFCNISVREQRKPKILCAPDGKGNVTIFCNWMSPFGPNVSDGKREKQVVLCPWIWTETKSLYTMLRRWRRGVLVSSLLVFHFGPESQRVLSSSYSSEFTV